MTARTGILAALFATVLVAQDPAPPAPAWTAGYDGGFFARSSDGRNELVFEGLFQVDYVAFERSEVRTSEFEVRRMRPELAGRFADYLRFRIEPNFADDGVELEEAWVGAELGGRDTLLMLGRMKAPFGLEEVRSRRYIDFPRFSILNQFSPAEDHGVFLNGRAAERLIEYGVAAYNGTGDADTNNSKDVAARFMVHPFAADEASPLRNLQIGIAGTFGQEDQDLAGEAITNAFGAPTILWADGARLDGERTRLGLEIAWFHGPVMAQAEALLVRQEMRQGSAADAVQFRGAYLDAGVVLTGEDKSFAGVKPLHPVGGGAGGRGGGAFVLAGRVSVLDVDRSLQDLALVEASTFTSDIRSVELGLVWVLDSHALMRCAYAHSFYADDITLGSRSFDNEGALRIEWQLHF